MKLKILASIISAALTCTATQAAADTAARELQACKIAAVLGGNHKDDIEAVLNDVTAHWTSLNRTKAVQQLSDLLDAQRFAGASLWETLAFGNEYVEMVILLRLDKGEIAGVHLVFENGDGRSLITYMNFRDRFRKIDNLNFAQSPRWIDCVS